MWYFLCLLSPNLKFPASHGTAAFHDFNDRLLPGLTDLINRLFTFLLMTYNRSSIWLEHTKIRFDTSPLRCRLSVL
jgi:hypothetical protein